MKKQGQCVKDLVIPDDYDAIQSAMRSWVEDQAVDVILTSGGTGISERDVTVDATLNVIEREIPGFGEEMRRRSAAITPFALISRATAGIVQQTLIINLPGSPKGAVECLSFIEKPLAHAMKILKMVRMDCAQEQKRMQELSQHND